MMADRLCYACNRQTVAVEGDRCGLCNMKLQTSEIFSRSKKAGTKAAVLVALILILTLGVILWLAKLGF